MGFTNEHGEPIMSGEAYRFECALDDARAYEDALDWYERYTYDDYDVEVDPSDCDHGDCSGNSETGDWSCDICGEVVPVRYDAELNGWYPVNTL